MSKEGRLRRGEKWYNLRDRDNNLPEGVVNDPEKMKDVDYFLKEKEKKKGEEEVKKGRK